MTHEASSFYTRKNQMTGALDFLKISDQNVSLAAQLDKGARALDIRPHITTDYELTMAHGPLYLSVTRLQEALQQVKDWIKEHPDEFVVLYNLIQNSDAVP